MYSSISVENYGLFKTWNKKFPDDEVNLKKIVYGESWRKMFSELFSDKRIEKTTKDLSDILKKDSDVEMYPPPELVFYTFLRTPFDNTNVVILGQDPYHGENQAMGLSFSVPYGMEIPSSLQNIYNNLIENKHMAKKPTHGNLEFWTNQGCLLLNTSLTVIGGKENANGHQAIWKWFTDKIIKYISDNRDHVVFVLWGGPASEKALLIDQDKHEVIITSHPSGLSANRPLKNYPAFNGYDHFKRINTVLEKWGKRPIIWNM